MIPSSLAMQACRVVSESEFPTPMSGPLVSRGAEVAVPPVAFRDAAARVRHSGRLARLWRPFRQRTSGMTPTGERRTRAHHRCWFHRRAPGPRATIFSLVMIALVWLLGAESAEAQSRPRVVSIDYISSPAVGDTYTRGEPITVRVTFDRNVTSIGTSALLLTIGAQIRIAASLTSRDRSVFYRYVVLADDLDTDGISIAANALAADGLITDAADGVTPADVRHDAVPADPTRKVDGSASRYGVVVSPQRMTVAEGGTSNYTVALVSAPTAAVTIAIAADASDDPDLTAAPSALTFTRSNWETVQFVTVSAAEDDDTIEGSATFTHTASSSDANYNRIDVASVTVTEREDDFAHDLYLFPLDSNTKWEGFARIINYSGEAGEVRIDGADNVGSRFGPVTLSMEAYQTRHFSSSDLADGNPSKGLPDGLGGRPVGNWRLRLITELDIEPLAYIRTGDGFVTTMHEVARSGGGKGAIEYYVPFFNPAGNESQVSRLRLMNQGDEAVDVTITGTDDDGMAPPGGDVALTLPAGEVRTITARQLEAGGGDLSGSFGDGAGKWRLLVTAEGPIEVMSLLESPTGHLANLSVPGIRGAAGEASEFTLPLFIAASNSVQQGFARIINHSDESGTVTIHGIDDAGTPHGPIELSLQPGETQHFNSQDLEEGNPSKALSDGLGDGDGDWRLSMRTELDIEPLAYIRTEDGFVTSMHELARRTAKGYHVPIFNPGSNASQRSRLRLINPTTTDVDVTITGLDDAGNPPSVGPVRVTLPAQAARTITAHELETGATHFDGRFGDGAGKWQLYVDADAPIEVLSLLESPTGHLANLSGTTDVVEPAKVLGIAIIGLGESILVTDQEYVTISGVAESNVPIARVQYLNLTTGTAGDATGTSEWSADVLLAEGENRLEFFVVTVNGESAVVETTLTYFPALDFSTVLNLSRTLLYQGEQDVEVIANIGTNSPNNPALSLVRVDEDAQTVVIDELLDNGIIPDEIQGDGIYSGAFEFDGDADGYYCYRIDVVDNQSNRYSSEQECIWLTERYTDEQVDNAVALADESAESYKTKVEQGASSAEAASTIATELEQDERVGAAGSTDDGGVWWVSSDGILGVFHPVFEGLKAGGASRSNSEGAVTNPPMSTESASNSISFYPTSYVDDRSAYVPDYRAHEGMSIKQTTADDDANRIESTKALLISPYLWEFGSTDDYYSAWQEIKNAQHCGLVPEREVVNFSSGSNVVRLQDFKDWSTFGYIHISSHGDNFYTGLLGVWDEVLWGPPDFLFGNLSLVGVYTGIDLPTDSDGEWDVSGHEDDIQNKRLAVGAGGTLVVLPHFFSTYLDPLPNSLVVISTCRSGYNNSLANVLLAKGAGAVVGFDDYVRSSYAHNTTSQIIRSMLDGATFGDAISATVLKYGASDGQGADLVSIGNRDLELASGTEFVNGDFESGNLVPWRKYGDGRVIPRLGTTRPTGGNYMGIISTGLGFTTTTGQISQPACISASTKTLTFNWNFFSEEFPEWCGTRFDDAFRIDVCESGGSQGCTSVFDTSVNKLCATPGALERSDVSFDIQDPNPAGRIDTGTGVSDTGWQSQVIAIGQYAGKRVDIRFFSTDRGDSIYDSAILLDDIRIE